MRPFAELAQNSASTLDRLALAIAAEFRDVDEPAALARLAELADEFVPGETPVEEGDALAALLGGRYGFAGNEASYDHPDNSMLDLVLERGAGLPILLSVVYEEVARRRGIPLHGVGLPGHFVVAHFGEDPPLVYDPFAGGERIDLDTPPDLVRAWRPQETALRILNNLVLAFSRHSELMKAIRAAELRLELPLAAGTYAELETELRSYRARLN
jgi:regulator of sirC expression with transglutaminase-like and TPR domain